MKLSMANAAYQILKETGEPKHYALLIKEMIDRELISTRGLTPGATLTAVISVENAKRVSRGEVPRFDVLGNGFYGLTEWQPTGIESRIQEINEATRTDLRVRLANMPPQDFEELIGKLLIAIGFDEETVVVRGKPGDGGIDVIGVMDIEGVTRLEAAVQVKRVKQNISAEKITALRGSLMPNQRGIFITTSKFTKQARDEASATGKSPISLVDNEQLLDLLFRHNIGVKSEQHIIYNIDSEYWPEPPSLTAPVVSPATHKVINAVRVSYPLDIFVKRSDEIVKAQLFESGHVLLGEQTYSSVSAAGMAVTGWKSCNGWSFWSFINPADNSTYLIDVLRQNNS
jgi:restriction system protein